MSYMFANCIKLEELNIDNLNTAKVRDISNILENDLPLKKYNFPVNRENFNKFDNMFYQYESL